MKIIHFTNHPLAPLMLIALLYFLFLSLRLNTHDAAFFVQAGEQLVDTTVAPDNLFTVTEFTGYDGTFYYRLALTPFTREPTAFGITLDNPRYRHQRILYPLLGYFFSFGSPPLVIYSLIVVNFLALSAMGWFAGLYAQAINRHALWGAAFPLYAGFLFTLSRNLTEIVSALFVMITLVALQRRRFVLATGALILAILAKETALLVAVAIAILWLRPLRRPNNAIPWYVGIVPGLVYALWQIALRFWWSVWPSNAAQSNMGPPFLGILEGFQQAASVVGGSPTRWAIEMTGLALLALVVLWVMRRSTAQPYEKVSWSLNVGLLILLTSAVWVEDWGFLRIVYLFHLFSVAILLNARSKLTNSVLLTSMGVWVVLAVDLLYFR